MLALPVATEVDGVRVHVDVHEVVDDFTLDVVLHPVDQETATNIYDLNEGQIPVGQSGERTVGQYLGNNCRRVVHKEFKTSSKQHRFVIHVGAENLPILWLHLLDIFCPSTFYYYYQKRPKTFPQARNVPVQCASNICKTL